MRTQRRIYSPWHNRALLVSTQALTHTRSIREYQFFPRNMAKRLRSNSGTLMVCRDGWKWFLVSFSDCFLVKNTREFLHGNLRLFGLLLAPRATKYLSIGRALGHTFHRWELFCFLSLETLFLPFKMFFFSSSQEKKNNKMCSGFGLIIFFCESRESWAMLPDSVRLWMETDFKRRGKNCYLNVH